MKMQSSPTEVKVKEEKFLDAFCCFCSDPTGNGSGDSKTIRDLPPAHYLFKIKSFSSLCLPDVKKYESDSFEAGGFKWKLSLYPNGHAERNGNGYVSLYLRIVQTESWACDWEVNANFKLFVFDQIRDKYLTIQGIMRFLRDHPPSPYSVKVEPFSLLVKSQVEKYESGAFEVGGYKWKLILYPNGNKKADGADYISLYLVIEDVSSLPHRWEVNVDVKLFVFDQRRKKYLTIQDAIRPIKRFHEMETEFGFAKLLALETFSDANNGYLVDDCCIFGAEVFVIQPTRKSECLSITEDPHSGTFS